MCKYQWYAKIENLCMRNTTKYQAKLTNRQINFTLSPYQTSGSPCLKIGFQLLFAEAGQGTLQNQKRSLAPEDSRGYL